LQFLCRKAFTPSELKVIGYIDYATNVKDFMKNQGYETLGDLSPTCNPYTMTIFRFRRKDCQGNVGRVLFWWTRDEGVLLPLLEAASFTADMNIIAWNKAQFLFPYNTFMAKDMYLLWILESVPPSRIMAHLEYFDLFTQLIHRDERHRDERVMRCKILTRLRRIGDKYTRVEDRDIEGVEHPETPNAVIASTTFRFGVYSKDSDYIWHWF
jgi:hypothetical protein